MRTPRFFAGAVAGLCLFFTACPSLTINQKQTAAAIGGAVLDLSQVAAQAAVNIVIARATSGADLTSKSNFLDSAAAGLRTLQTKTGGIVTPAEVGSVVSQFTDPTKTHWSDLATKLADAYAAAPPDASSNAKLEALATGLNTTAATATVAAQTP